MGVNGSHRTIWTHGADGSPAWAPYGQPTGDLAKLKRNGY
jgi:hypothetical protein